MINQINSINNIDPNNYTGISNQNKSISTFSDFLKAALDNVNNLQLKSQADDQKLVTGEIDDINQVMIDATKADIALQLTIQLKNKILDAYQEIMRMPV